MREQSIRKAKQVAQSMIERSEFMRERNALLVFTKENFKTEDDKKERVELPRLMKKAHIKHIRIKEGEHSGRATEVGKDVERNEDMNQTDRATEVFIVDTEESYSIDGKTGKYERRYDDSTNRKFNQCIFFERPTPTILVTIDLTSTRSPRPRRLPSFPRDQFLQPKSYWRNMFHVC